jgi:molybdenum cofactor cytidylyltransferase
MSEPLRQLAGILLAAGKGSRFDPSGLQNKLLQPLPGGEPVAAAAAKKLLSVLPRTLAVVRPGAAAVAAQLDALGCEVVECPDAGQGMGASLAFAVARTDYASGWLIALADMPYVQTATVQALVDAITNGADIAVPTHAGRRGNPVAFSRRHLAELLALAGDQGARRLLTSCPVTEVAGDDAGIHRDIDTLDDLGEN